MTVETNLAGARQENAGHALLREPGKKELHMQDIAQRAPARNSDGKLEFHPLADLFPLMEGAEFDELVEDIKKNGLREPIVLYEDMILDGRNRYRACIKAGVDPFPPTEGGKCAALNYLGDDPAGFVISKNIHRRHLIAEQKRDLITKLLKAAPDRSNNATAKIAKVDDKTVAAVRRELEATSEIPKLEKTVGADGKARALPKKKTSAAKAAERRRRARERSAAQRERAKAEAARQRQGIKAAQRAETKRLADDLIQACPDIARRMCDWLGENAHYYDLSCELDHGLKIDGYTFDIEPEGNDADTEQSTEKRREEFAKIDDGSDPGPIPACLRRSP